jgi:hypothetical protein
MELTITISLLKRTKLTPNQLTLLFLLYHSKLTEIEEIFGRVEAVNIRNSLIGTPYLLSGQTKFVDTVLSKNQVEKLLGIRSDQINFWEFYTQYPVKVGSRVLRASGPTTTVALKHEKKYLARVKTIEQHQQAIKAIECFVSKQRQANKLQYLPGMDVVLNNNMWEQWEVFIENSGEEGKEWNSDTI